MSRLIVGVVLVCLLTGCYASPTAPPKNDCTSQVMPDGSIEHGCPGR